MTSSAANAFFVHKKHSLLTLPNERMLNRMKKLLGVLCAAVIVAGIVSIWSAAVGSGAQGSPSPADPTRSGQPQVYYLNFKPEQARRWEEVAKTYTALTGVPVTVVTAASGAYEDTLRAELEKADPPTLFQVNGPVGLRTWRGYCADLSDTALYKALPSDEFALRDGGEVKAVAYAIETYGLIVNKTLLQKAGYDLRDIDGFASLKAVAEDIHARRDELGFDAFTSAGMDPGSDWRFKTHMMNLPLYYEYRDAGVTQADAVTGRYLPQVKQLWDLYLNNATCEPGLIGARTGEDAAAEFALGEAVFYQNGTWAYDSCVAEGLTDDDLAMLPIYIGVEGEQAQGLCTGSENYWCINSAADSADIAVTKTFVNWLATDPQGLAALHDMGFVTPFDQGMQQQNALLTAASESLAAGKTPVSWAFLTMPSETWKNNVGAALLDYAQGRADWSAVERAYIDGWAAESAAAN